MPNECTQGALNTQAIRDLKDANILLFQKIEDDSKIKNDILVMLTRIETTQTQEKQHRINLDKDLRKQSEIFSEHVKESPDRINDVKCEVRIERRKDLLWFIGLPAAGLALLGYGVNLLLSMAKFKGG